MAIQANDPVLSKTPTDATLLDNSLDDNSLEDKLLLGASNGDSNQVAELLDSSILVQGFDVNYRNPCSGFTALMIAAEKGHFDIVKLLIEANADFNLRNDDQNSDYFADISGVRSALSLAAEKGRLQIVQMLIGARATIDFDNDSCDISALALAAENGYLEIVEYLIANNAKIEDDHDNPSPLILAARGGHVEVMATLIAAGADPLRITCDGETPLMAAAQSGNDKAVQLLVNSFMDPTSKGKELLERITIIVEETCSLKILDMLDRNTIKDLYDHLIDSNRGDIYSFLKKVDLTMRTMHAMKPLDVLKAYFKSDNPALATEINYAQMETPRTPDTIPEDPDRSAKKREVAFFYRQDAKKRKMDGGNKENIIPHEGDAEDFDHGYAEGGENLQKLEEELEIAAKNLDIPFPTPPDLQKEEPLPLVLGTHCAFYQNAIKSDVSETFSTSVSTVTQKR